MKDSRIGTSGALALGFSVALRIAALTQLPLWAGAFALLASHAAARATPGFVIGAMRYAGDTDGKKVSYAETPMTSDETWFALISVAISALPLAFISVSSVFFWALLGAALAAALANYGRGGSIGGYTGDVLGAIEQMFRNRVPAGRCRDHSIGQDNGSRYGSPSKASAPRPMRWIASVIRPPRPSKSSASDTIRRFGVTDGARRRNSSAISRSKPGLRSQAIT